MAWANRIRPMMEHPMMAGRGECNSPHNVSPDNRGEFNSPHNVSPDDGMGECNSPHNVSPDDGMGECNSPPQGQLCVGINRLLQKKT